MLEFLSWFKAKSLPSILVLNLINCIHQNLSYNCLALVILSLFDCLIIDYYCMQFAIALSL